MSKLTRLSGRLWILEGSPKTIIVVAEDVCWIVDPGMGTNRTNEITAFIEKIAQNKEVNVLISHAHYDHIEALENLNCSKVFAHIKEVSALVDPSVRERFVYGHNPFPRAHKLKKMSFENIAIETFSNPKELSTDFEVIGLEGHSPGQVGIIFEDVLFVADALFGDKLIRRVGVPYHVDVEGAISALEHILEIAKEVDKLVMGHGPILNKKRVLEIIELNINTIKTVKDLVISHISAKFLSLEELSYNVLRDLNADTSYTSIILAIPTITSIIESFLKEHEVKVKVENSLVKWKLV